MNKIYTGIGSRETPQIALSCFTTLAMMLAQEGYTLRSGGAEGADSAFEKGAGDNKEIYLPWKNFSNNPSNNFVVSEEALEMAAKYHLYWDRCSPGARKLHGRNCYQVLGLDLKSPTDFIVCYTKDGKGGGGTGQALRIAKDLGIKIFDAGSYKDYYLFCEEVMNYVQEMQGLQENNPL